eukprot:scaffold28711_cov65-Phaeocystis_antarctica.AAC.6
MAILPRVRMARCAPQPHDTRHRPHSTAHRAADGHVGRQRLGDGWVDALLVEEVPLGDLVVLVVAQGVEDGAPASVAQFVALEIDLLQRAVDLQDLCDPHATNCADAIAADVEGGQVRAHDGQEAHQHIEVRSIRLAHTAAHKVERERAASFLAKPLDRDTSNYAAARR